MAATVENKFRTINYWAIEYWFQEVFGPYYQPFPNKQTAFKALRTHSWGKNPRLVKITETIEYV